MKECLVTALSPLGIRLESERWGCAILQWHLPFEFGSHQMFQSRENMIKCSVKNSSDPSMKDLRWGRVGSREEIVSVKGPDKGLELEKYWKKWKGGHEVV